MSISKPANTPTVHQPTMDSKIKIISYNAQGLKTKNKRDKVINWAMKKMFDILAIQESHYEESDEDKWKESWKGKIYSSSGSNNSRGVTILISENLEHEILQKHKDEHGRWIILELAIRNKTYLVGNYYGPNNDDPSHAKDMIEKIEEVGNPNLILCGDYNFVFNIKMDK